MNGNLELARKNLKLVALQLNNWDEDYLNTACYHVEQAIELCCKFLLNRAGVSMNKRHDIPSIFHSVAQTGYALDPVLWENSAVIRSWATESRYNLNFKDTLDRCTQLYTKAQALFSSCAALDQTDPEAENA